MESGGLFYVPWFNLNEWLLVRDNLLSEDVTKWKRAHELISMWKMRCKALPTNIECTLGILQVIVEDYSKQMEQQKPSFDLLFKKEEELVLSFSTAIVRFVNHVVVEPGATETLYEGARKNNIPDWIINLRHDIAHGQTLPPLELLRCACRFAFQWLLRTYWQKEDTNMLALEGITIKGRSDPKPTDLQIILAAGLNALRLCGIGMRRRRFWTSLLTDEEWGSVKKFNKKVRKVTVTGDLSSRLRSIVRATKIIRSSESDDRGHRVSSVVLVIRKIMEQLASKGNILTKNVIDALFQTDFLSDSDTDFVKWKYVIRLVHKFGSLTYLIRCLFSKVDGEHVLSSQAASWLTFLVGPLEILNLQYEEFRRLKKQGGKNNSYWKQSAIESIPYPKGSIPLQIKKPPAITLEMLKPALMNPTHFSANTMSKYLSLVNPPLPVPAKELAEKLLAIYYNNADIENMEVQSNITYDVPILLASKSSSSGQDVHLMNGFTVGNETTGNWKKVLIDPKVWRRHPLGILPGQFSPDLDLSRVPWRFCPASQSSGQKSSVPAFNGSA